MARSPCADADIEIWGVSLPVEGLNQDERRYLATLPDEPPSHGWVCSELDRVWHALGLDNKQPLLEQPVAEFYSHPVWLMNGIYSAADPASSSHRRALARCIEQFSPSAVADFGGGFGELARRLGEALPEATITIIDPFPSSLGLKRLESFPRIAFESTLETNRYDVIVAQDVLEHVDQPLALAVAMARSVRPAGYAIFANNFNPVIDCHLPATFHLRHTFPHVMTALGLTLVGRVPGAGHAQVYRVPEHLDIDRAMRAERLSKLVGPLINVGYKIWSQLRRSTAAAYRRLVGSRR